MFSQHATVLLDLCLCYSMVIFLQLQAQLGISLELNHLKLSSKKAVVAQMWSPQSCQKLAKPTQKPPTPKVLRRCLRSRKPLG